LLQSSSSGATCVDLTGSIGAMNDDAMLILLQDLQTAVANGDHSAVQTIGETRLVHAGRSDKLCRIMLMGRM
jgi:hypothetical protein